MTWFEKVGETKSDERLATIYKEMKLHLGDPSPPALFATAGSRPDILEAVWKMSRILLVEGHLSAALKQFVLIAIATQSGCRYCSAVHARWLETLGTPRKEIERFARNPHAAGDEEPRRSVVAFALKAAANPNGLVEDDFASLRQNGLDQEEISELCMLVGFALFLTTWADATGLRAEDAA